MDAITDHDGVWRLNSSSGPATTRAVLDLAAQSGITVKSLSVQSTTLDDVFVHYTGRALRDALRVAGDMERPFRQSQVDAAVRFCGKVFGKDYAALLAKAAEVASHAEQRKAALA